MLWSCGDIVFDQYAVPSPCYGNHHIFDQELTGMFGKILIKYLVISCHFLTSHLDIICQEMTITSLLDSCKESCSIVPYPYKNSWISLIKNWQECLVWFLQRILPFPCIFLDAICQEITAITLQDSCRESCLVLTRVLDQDLMRMLGMILTKNLAISPHFLSCQ